MALLYLALFSALALGFYAQMTLGAQIAHNEMRAAQAQVAAESGMYFLRYQLTRVKVAPTVAPTGVLQDVYNQLSAKLGPTANLTGMSVGFSPGVINIPAGDNQFIRLQKTGPQFRATLTLKADGTLMARITGRDSSGAARRVIRADFARDEVRSPVLDYGVATNGPISLSKGFIKGEPAALGDVLSTASGASPVTMSGGTASISGEVYLSSPTGSVTGDGSVAGISDKSLRAAHVHPNTRVPEFPGIDPAPFVKYLQGKETLVTGNTGVKYLSNIRIKAGTNPNLGNSPTVEGVILIEAPNQVTFSGTEGTTIRGVIVVANPAEGTGTNKVSFTGGVKMYGVQTLADSFGELKAMGGASILAPNFTVEMSGGSSSIGGTILAKNLILSGASGGTVAGNVLLVGTGTLTIPQNSTITITAPASTAKPAGFVFSHSYALRPETYLEVDP